MALGCSIPPASAPVPTTVPTPSHTPTVIAAPTATPVLIPSPTPDPAPVRTSTPGPALALWYLSDGRLFRYDLRNWESEPVLLLTTGPIDAAQLNPTGRLVAYSDEEGLKTVERTSGTIRLVFRHISLAMATPALDESDVRFYTPRGWSPDGRWLMLGVGYYERNLTLASVSARTLLPLPLPCSSYSWAPQSQALVLGVRLDPQRPCGEPGLYLLSVAEGLPWQRLYRPLVATPSGPEAAPRLITQGISSPAWSPGGEWIAFVTEETTDNELGSRARILLIGANGEGERQLANTSDLQPFASRLSSLAWSPSGEVLYFTLSGRATQHIYSVEVNTLSAALLHTTYDMYSHSVSPDGQWLLLHCCSLLNLVTGEVVPITQFGQFVGWETFGAE